MPNVLSDTQQRFLESFFSSDAVGSHFYLSGGTALAAFYLHHRYSDDIDLFTRNPEEIVKARTHVRASLAACGLEVTEAREGEQMSEYKVVGDPRLTHPLRKVDVVWDTDPAFAPPEARGILRVDALLNIAVNKVTTIFSRSEIKDYVDLYFILKVRPFDLDVLLPLAGQKDLGFDELMFATNLAGVRELQGLLPFLQDYMISPLDPEVLVRFCEETAGRIIDRHPPAGS